MNEDRATEIVRRVPRLDERWLIDEEDMPETPLHDRATDLLVQVLRVGPPLCPTPEETSLAQRDAAVAENERLRAELARSRG